MRDLDRMRERFLRDEPSRRLANIASDLLRLSAWVNTGARDQAALDLVRELASQMEWIGEAATEELADMQRELCRWRKVPSLDPVRPILALRARQMSGRLLKLSGLAG